MDVITLPFQGGNIFVFRDPGRRRKRLCPGLLYLGLSGRKMYSGDLGNIVSQIHSKYLTRIPKPRAETFTPSPRVLVT